MSEAALPAPGSKRAWSWPWQLAFVAGLGGLAYVLAAGHPGLWPPAALVAALAALGYAAGVLTAEARGSAWWRRLFPLVPAGLAVVSPDAVWTVVLLAILVAQMGAWAEPGWPKLRSQLTGLCLLALGALTRGAPGGVGNVSALAAALALPALAGLPPFAARGQRPLDPGDLIWPGLLAPLVALAVWRTFLPAMTSTQGEVFCAVSLGVGLFDLFVGSLAAIRARDGWRLWRHSTTAEWGLALVALGLVGATGWEAALVLLLSLSALRLPLIFWTEETAAAGTGRRDRLLLGASLAGAAPFAGFSARVLILEAAAAFHWELAALVAVPMLLIPIHAFRLGAHVNVRGPVRKSVLGALLLVSITLGVAPGIITLRAGW